MKTNDSGVGVGEHAISCQEEVKFRCACGHNFRGRYAKVKFDFRDHLKNECVSVLTANTRRLAKAVNRFDELGLHPELIKFYKDQEPFYYLDPSDERDERFPLTKNYVANLDKVDRYEGEVDL